MNNSTSLALPLVLFAIPELDAGGPDRVFFELLAHLPRHRFRIALVVGRGGGRYFDRLPDDVETSAIGGGRYPVRQLAHAIDRFRPAILLTTLRMNLTAAAALLLARHKPLFVARQANAIASDFAVLKRQSLVKHRLAERVTFWALRRADAVIAQSNDMADELARSVRARQRLVTIGNPIAMPEIEAHAAEQQAACDGPAGRPALISVGRLAAQKGYDMLVAALPAIRAVHPATELTVLGEGAERAALIAQAISLGVGDALHLPGQSDAVQAMIANADLFVSTSRYEGFPNVVLEAMAVGTPVVATLCPGGTAELVVDQETGWLARDLTPSAIAAAVLTALAGDGAGVATAARARIEARFSRDMIVAGYSGLLSDMLSDRA